MLYATGKHPQLALDYMGIFREHFARSIPVVVVVVVVTEAKIS